LTESNLPDQEYVLRGI